MRRVRNNGGYVCKDKLSCERTQKQLQMNERLYSELDRLDGHWEALRQAYVARDAMHVLSMLRVFHETTADLIIETVQSIAKNNGKHYTQKEIAQALDIPVSALRGLKQSVR
jgi:hypothetical protein